MIKRIKCFCIILSVVFLVSSMLTKATFAVPGDEFLISIFWPPSAALTNSTQYDYLRDASINMTMPGNDIDTVAENNAIMSLCSTRGILHQAGDSRYGTIYTATDAEIDAIANDYKNNPACGGFHIKDEPPATEFTRLAYIYNRFLDHAPDLIPNVNLLPNSVSPTDLGVGPITANFQSAANSGVYVTPSNRVGQTFTTDSQTYFIEAIQLYIDSSTWSTSEALTLTLWNSPAKTSKICEQFLWGSNSGNYPIFAMGASVSPNTTYYMELTHNGGGDNSVGWVCLSTANPVAGDMYQNGTIVVNNDLYYKIRRGRSLHDKSVSQITANDGSYINTSTKFGQTFKTPSVLNRRLDYIEMYIDRTTWTSDETLTLVVYDSPSKNQILGHCALTGTNNGNLPRFSLEADLKPNTTYFFELSYSGPNHVGWVLKSTANPYADGSAYVNGVQQTTTDFYFKAIFSSFYQDYLNEWVDAVGAANLKYLFFDHYPFRVAPGISTGYFLNLEQARNIGLQNNVKTGSYLQTVGIPGAYRRPTANEVRYNAFTSLAYGMKDLRYFTWFTPVNQGETFTNAIIDPNGVKTDLYAPVQAINSQIKNLGPTLMTLTSQAVYHNGVREIGTQSVPKNFWWKSGANDQVIISYFTNASGRKYIMVVCRGYTDPGATFTFTLNPKPTTVTEISKTTGAEVSTNYSSSTGTLSATFLPGEGKLYALPVGY